MLRLMGRRHEEADISADDFGGSVTKHLFSRQVEGFDETGLADGDDAFDRRFENGLQPRFAVAQDGGGLVPASAGLGSLPGLELLNPSKQGAPGHFTIVYHLADAATIVKFPAAANSKHRISHPKLSGSP
jgi:hypothetical protein